MNQKQMKEFMKALNAIAEEKKIDKNVVVEAMEQAMAAAYKKNEGLTNVMAKVDDVTGDIRIYSYKTEASSNDISKSGFSTVSTTVLYE